MYSFFGHTYSANHSAIVLTKSNFNTGDTFSVALEKSGKTGQNFAYTLQNIAIAVNAKLGGIPWRINMPEAKELVIGVGAFKNTDTNVQYIASAFSFDNTGAFNSFEYFHKYEVSELAGSIEDAIINYANINNKPNRLVIHFYKEMSEEEIEKNIMKKSMVFLR